MSERGRGRSRFPAEQGACLGTWIMIWASCRSLTDWSIQVLLDLGPQLQDLSQGNSVGLGCCLFFFFIINLFFIDVQFANLQNNTQCSSHQVPPSVPVTHSPPPPPSSPSTTPSSIPRVRSLYVLSPFLIFPTHFLSLPFYSLSLLFIFPKWMRTYNVCPSPTDLSFIFLHVAV